MVNIQEISKKLLQNYMKKAEDSILDRKISRKKSHKRMIKIEDANSKVKKIKESKSAFDRMLKLHKTNTGRDLNQLGKKALEAKKAIINSNKKREFMNKTDESIEIDSNDLDESYSDVKDIYKKEVGKNLATIVGLYEKICKLDENPKKHVYCDWRSLSISTEILRDTLLQRIPDPVKNVKESLSESKVDVLALMKKIGREKNAKKLKDMESQLKQMKEETDLTELSNKLLSKYVSKASSETGKRDHLDKSTSNKILATNNLHLIGKLEKFKKVNAKRLAKRKDGVEKALGKIK